MHSPVLTSHTLRVLSCDPDTTRRPFGNTATQRTYNEDTSSQKHSGRRAPHVTRVPLQRRHAFPLATFDVPHLERLVGRRRHDTPPVPRHRHAPDLRRSQITTVPQKADAARRTTSECPCSVATHLPVATSQTLSVLSCDPDTTRRPSGNTATLWTYNEDTSSQKYSGRRNALHTSALAASPRICRSPRPRP